ncbi:MAG: hypothetical protein ACYTG5_04910 [Planctomycetota bacterium]|jgi:hypothetical protein
METRAARPGLGLLIITALLASPTQAQKTPTIRLDRDPPGSAHSWSPQIAASGDSVYVVWEDRRGGPSGLSGDIYFNRSIDGGATWLAADLRLDTDLPGAASSSSPQIAVIGDSVYVTWIDGRNFTTDIYFNRSKDGGVTWLAADIQLDSNSPGGTQSSFPQITAVGDSVYVAWAETPIFQGNKEGGVFFNRSIDGGVTWLPSNLRLSTTPSPLSVFDTNFFKTRIAASGDSVFVVWEDERNDTSPPGPANAPPPPPVYDIYFRHSLDGGANWQSPDTRLNTSPPGVNSSEEPQIAVSGDSVYVVWQEKRNDSPFSESYLNRSTDGGANWLSSDLRLDNDTPGNANSWFPQIAVADDSVYVAWQDSRSGFSDIYFNRSLDAGASWLRSDRRLDTDLPGSSISGFVQIAASGPSVYVAWQDDRQGRGQRNIYFNRSIDAGDTWLASDVRLDSDRRSASGAPLMAATGDSVYVAWNGFEADDRVDVYFTIPFGAQPFGEGTSGSNAITPELEGTDSLTLGSTFTLSVSDGLGAAFGAILLGGPGSKTDIPMLGGSLLIDPIEQIVPIRLEGAAGVPGDGSYSVAIPIPNENALLGFNINLQALFIDPGAPGSVSWTNGVEAWIL